MLFEVSKKRFIEELIRWCQSGDKIVNYSKIDGIYNFYLSTLDGDYVCVILEEEISGSDKMNLFGKGKLVFRRIRDDDVLQDLSESIQNNSSELSIISQTLNRADGNRKSEIMMKELLEKKHGIS